MEKFGKRLEGKVAILTASTNGIGFAMAERLGLEGASVVVSSRKQNNVDEAVEKLKGKGIQASGVVCHVSDALQRKKLIDHTIQVYGKIDVIVYSAGVNPTPGSILNTKEAALNKLWEVNVRAAVLLLQDAAPHLAKGSSIIFLSTVGAYLPQPMMALYGVAKAAVLMLTKALAKEMAPDTRVNCIASGYVPTKFSQIITGNDWIRNSIVEATLLKRPGNVQEIAAAAAFLASDDASYITGETLAVAGGFPTRL